MLNIDQTMRLELAVISQGIVHRGKLNTLTLVCKAIFLNNLLLPLINQYQV